MLTRRAVALPLFAFALTGCDGPRGLVAEGPVPVASPGFAKYRLARGDKVKVTVFNEPDLTGEFQVNDAGAIAFPLVGSIRAAGLTVSELADRLQRRLRGGYVEEPHVSVEITTYRPFNIVGEVRNAGQYPFRPGLTVQDAIAIAGGFTYRANEYRAYLRRANTVGEMIVELNGPRVAILPGDDVRIPERYF